MSQMQEVDEEKGSLSGEACIFTLILTLLTCENLAMATINI
jgi:hypothetical protein